jgi:hypothetical protein
MNLNTDLTKKICLVLATVAALAVSPTLLGVIQTAEAASNKQVQGSGSGTVFCANAPFTTFSAGIQFSATKNKGFMSGSWQIFGSKSAFGTINSGSIGENSFSLSGIENFGFCAGTQPTPVPMTIKGECGTGAEIIFEAANGERGRFTGNVACS